LSLLLARSSSCDITPRGRPIRLAGYAPRTEPTAAILDPIEISAVLLEGAGQCCLIFSFDLMIVGAELQVMILARLASHGYASNEIILLASHTHFAPATDRACAPLGPPETQFVNEVAEAAEGLLLRMLAEPAVEIGLGIAQGRLDHSINRRRDWPFPTLGRTYGLRLSSVAMAPNPQGATHELATMLLLRRADDASRSPRSGTTPAIPPPWSPTMSSVPIIPARCGARCGSSSDRFHACSRKGSAATSLRS
jgi:hypothetical protein